MVRCTVKLPKILYLVLLISKHAKNAVYYNTNDLNKLANEFMPELVRLRKDKKDYRFLDDTNFGGLRGNFSTLLTLRGFVKRNNKFTPYYGIGRNDRLFNAFKNGDIILDTKDYIAHTLNENLKTLLENEVKNFTIRENQAHIKIFLEKNEDFALKRDVDNFKKIAVLKSENNKYFLRVLFNTFINKDIVEFNMYSYLKGAKIRQFNMHALFGIPSDDNAYDEFYVIDSKELLNKAPVFLYFNKQAEKFYDTNGNVYKSYKLDDSLKKLSAQDGNIEERLLYSWETIRNKWLEKSVSTEPKDIKRAEFSEFLEHFLKWKKNFSIFQKDVTGMTESASGGADVILQFSGGTTQKLELEHKWNNYIQHGHYKDTAWKDTWLYANEKWDFEHIKKIFMPYIDKYYDCIPKVFLCVNEQTQVKEAYEVNWKTLNFEQVEING